MASFPPPTYHRRVSGFVEMRVISNMKCLTNRNFSSFHKLILSHGYSYEWLNQFICPWIKFPVRSLAGL